MKQTNVLKPSQIVLQQTMYQKMGINSIGLILLFIFTITLTNISYAFTPFNKAVMNKKPSETAEILSTVDAYGRTNPNGTVKGILKAIQQQDSGRLTYYLPQDFVNTELTNKTTQNKLLQDLSVIFNKHSELIELSEISKADEGILDDTLTEDKEKIGNLIYTDLAESEQNIYLQRVEQDKKSVWVLHADFLEQVPFLSQRYQSSWLDDHLHPDLKQEVWGYTIGHILVSQVLLVFALIIGYIFALGLLVLKRATYSLHKKTLSLKAFCIPVTFIIGTFIYQYLLNLMHIERQTQALSLPIVNTLNILAIAWLLYRLLKLFSERLTQDELQQKHGLQISFIHLFDGLIKFLLIFFTGLLILENFDVDVSSGFALLGLGGLAFALGTQKTIENLVGSVVVVADKPVDIGDVCRFEDTVGRVESIGIRSTRIRTLERTIVTIPNGLFSSIKIENLSKKDKFLFEHTFSLSLLTPVSVIEKLLVQMQQTLMADSDVDTDDAYVRLCATERDAFKIRIFCYILVTEKPIFLEKQEQLLLALLSLLNDSQANLAIPASVISMGVE